MNILITGASGFLGSALALRLGELSHQVSLLVRKNTNLHRITDLSPYKIGRCEADREINQFIYDVYPDIVIHTACCYGRSGESISQITDSNFQFGAVILSALKDLKKKITFINTGTVLPRDVSLYALTKIQFEELGDYIANTSNQNIQFINIKLQHMYGPGDDVSKFTSHVINSCKNNVPTLPLTLGEQKRDFIYIDDVVDAYIKIMDRAKTLNESEKIELGSGIASRLRDFVEVAHKLTNSKTELLFGRLPYRENDEMCLVANIERLKNLGWIPKFNIDEGIKKTIEMDAIR
ncbi:NAD(P)-dependent oxidoreductase [Polynucleobacter paneuropaeus]|jgi:nucleoside-diphosphate-sugar epimerase|nr:NAD(P)-dependent oxidoreductase [Polynucleobacter paneuropaeus]MBT8611221.1 NAD(P)-dependent oxidoreductase [Polynucleobacter paneuropaeus]